MRKKAKSQPKSENHREFEMIDSIANQIKPGSTTQRSLGKSGNLSMYHRFPLIARGNITPTCKKISHRSSSQVPARSHSNRRNKKKRQTKLIKNNAGGF